MSLEDWSSALLYCRKSIPCYRSRPFIWDATIISWIWCILDFEKFPHHQFWSDKQCLSVLISIMLCNSWFIVYQGFVVYLNDWKVCDWKVCVLCYDCPGVYMQYHPLLGLQLYTCGKLEWYTKILFLLCIIVSEIINIIHNVTWHWQTDRNETYFL